MPRVSSLIVLILISTAACDTTTGLSAEWEPKLLRSGTGEEAKRLAEQYLTETLARPDLSPERRAHIQQLLKGFSPDIRRPGADPVIRTLSDGDDPSWVQGWTIIHPGYSINVYTELTKLAEIRHAMIAWTETAGSYPALHHNTGFWNDDRLDSMWNAPECVQGEQAGANSTHEWIWNGGSEKANRYTEDAGVCPAWQPE